MREQHQYIRKFYLELSNPRETQFEFDDEGVEKDNPSGRNLFTAAQKVCEKNLDNWKSKTQDSIGVTKIVLTKTTIEDEIDKDFLTFRISDKKGNLHHLYISRTLSDDKTNIEYGIAFVSPTLQHTPEHFIEDIYKEIKKLPIYGSRIKDRLDNDRGDDDSQRTKPNPKKPKPKPVLSGRE